MIKAKELKRRIELDGAQACYEHVTGSLEEGHLKPDDFSLRDLAENLVENGREWVRAMNPQGGYEVQEDAVDSTAFKNISGQIFYYKILAGYQSEAFHLSKLVSTIPTRLDGEKIPGVGRIGDQAESVGEAMPFPSQGFGEDWITTPSTDKKGLIVPVTKEAIFFDRTNLVLRRAGEVGESLGLNKEKRLCDIAWGIVNNYNWKGVAYNTYQSGAPWINTASGATSELLDWKAIDIAEQLFADILDPNTGEPVLINTANMSLMHMPAYRHQARHITRATSLERVDNQAAAGTVRTHSPNTVDSYRLVESKIGYRRVIASGVAAGTAKKQWVLGDFAKAFAYMENWPITVTQAPTNSEAEFTNDIVMRFKASERGVAAVLDPRYVVKMAGS